MYRVLEAILLMPHLSSRSNNDDDDDDDDDDVLQLIQEAIDHGDTHKDTMQLADYWLLVSVHHCICLLISLLYNHFYS